MFYRMRRRKVRRRGSSKEWARLELKSGGGAPASRGVSGLRQGLPERLKGGKHLGNPVAANRSRNFGRIPWRDQSLPCSGRVSFGV